MQHLQKTQGEGLLWLTSLSEEDKLSRGASRRGTCLLLTPDQGFLSPATGCSLRVTSGTGFSLCEPQLNRDSAIESTSAVRESRPAQGALRELCAKYFSAGPKNCRTIHSYFWDATLARS